MTTPARGCSARVRPPIERLLVRASIAIAAVLAPFGVAAQVGGSISVKSDERFRGRSLSDGRPVATVDISYDSKDGPYAGGSATAILTGKSRAGLLGARTYAGYAARMSAGVTLDAGVTGYLFTNRYSGNRNDQYVEVYAGLSRGPLSGYLRFSPDYLGRRTSVVYADISAARQIAPDWRLSGHVGLLVQTSGAPDLGGRRSRYDARIGVTRTIGPFEAQAALTFAGPGGRYFQGPWHGRSAVALSLRRSF